MISVSSTADRGVTTILVEGREVARHARSAPKEPGRLVDLQARFDFPGYLLLDESFFHRFDIAKPTTTGSRMINLAKGFLRFENHSHAALVQYLPPGLSSSRHHHLLPELIAGLAGEASFELDPLDGSPPSKGMITPGTVLIVPPRTWHRITAGSSGSITVPVKETRKGKKDHFYDVCWLDPEAAHPAPGQDARHGWKET